jgi:hypothetical protein
MVCALILRGHIVHFVVFGLPVAGLVGAVGLQEIRARFATADGIAADDSDGPRPGVPLDRRSPGLIMAVAGLVGAAAVHAAVIPDHFHEYVLYGIFFTALTAVQLSLALFLSVRPDPRTVRYIAIGSAGVVLLYVVSRTSGVPVGPEPWQPESFGGLDIAATVAELVTLSGCLMQLFAVSNRDRRSARRLTGVTR